MCLHRYQRADLQPRRLVVQHHQLRRRQDLYLGDGGQRVDHLAHPVGQHKTGEFTADGCRNAADRDRGGASGGVGAGGLTAAGQDAGEFVPEIELRAVIQRVVEGDFGDRRLD